MTRLTIAITVLIGCSPVAVRGQNPVAPAQRPTLDYSPGSLTPTPEMWFYDQERRRREDPSEMIRERAEFRSRQRQQRLAAVRWYGFSNSRPAANSGIFMSTWSPTWIGNTYDPFAWRGATGNAVVINTRSAVAY